MTKLSLETLNFVDEVNIVNFLYYQLSNEYRGNISSRHSRSSEADSRKSCFQTIILSKT